LGRGGLALVWEELRAVADANLKIEGAAVAHNL
jgi:hypothetical protein